MIGTIAFPQQLKLGKSPYTIEKSAVLELQADNQGLLLSRITDTSLINSLNPSDGMVIFHVPSKRLLLRTDGYWTPLVPSASLSDFWSVNGNTNGSAKKLGNTDNFDLSFITANTDRLRITSAGNIGINNPAPTEKLDITGNLRLSGALMPGNNPGATGELLQSNGPGAAPSWFNVSGYLNALAWTLGGNAVGYTRTLGTTNSFDLPFITTNIERMRILANGSIGIGTSAPSTTLHVRSGINGDSGLRLENLTTASAATANVATLGVDATGKVVRSRVPEYYSGTGTTATVDPVTKIWLAEVANTTTGIVTVTIPANVGFTTILGIQVTAKGGTSAATAPIVSVTSNTLSGLTLRVLESKTTVVGSNGGSVEGLEAETANATRIYIRVEGN
jgi:hypothetical protein